MARIRRKTSWIHCAECGRNGKHKGYGLCRLCYDRQWREANPEKHREYSRKWREANPLEALESTRKWREANPLEALEMGRRYREARREEIAECKRRWNEANPDKVREQGLRYREAHREELRESGRQWKKANPDKRRAQSRRRKARKRGATTVDGVDEAAIYEHDGHACIYCGSAEDLTLDHIVSLFSGGPHCEDNLVVACRRCNCSKGARPLTEWLETQPYSQAWVL